MTKKYSIVNESGEKVFVAYGTSISQTDGYGSIVYYNGDTVAVIPLGKVIVVEELKEQLQ